MPRPLIDMIHGYIQATMLQVKVHVGIHNWVIANLDTLVLSVLHGKLPHGSRIIGGIIRGEVTEVTAQLHPQDLGNAEKQIEVGVE